MVDEFQWGAPGTPLTEAEVREMHRLTTPSERYVFEHAHPDARLVDWAQIGARPGDDAKKRIVDKLSNITWKELDVFGDGPETHITRSVVDPETGLIHLPPNALADNPVQREVFEAVAHELPFSQNRLRQV